jgi:Phage integrase family
MPPARPYKHITKRLAADERRRLLAAIETLPIEQALFVFTFAYAGGRVSQTLALTPSSFLTEHAVVALKRTWRRKPATREVRIPAELMQALDRHFRLAEAQDDPGRAHARLRLFRRETAWKHIQHLMRATSISGPQASAHALRRALTPRRTSPSPQATGALFNPLAIARQPRASAASGVILLRISSCAGRGMFRRCCALQPWSAPIQEAWRSAPRWCAQSHAPAAHRSPTATSWRAFPAALTYGAQRLRGRLRLARAKPGRWRWTSLISMPPWKLHRNPRKKSPRRR